MCLGLCSSLAEPPPPEDPKAKKAPPKKDPKKAEEPPPPAGPPPEIPGWDIVTATLETINERVREYDEWRSKVKVYDATPAGADNASYYNSLLDTVAPERISVPVIMHAMLEQVTRNMQVSTAKHIK